MLRGEAQAEKNDLTATAEGTFTLNAGAELTAQASISLRAKYEL